MLFRSEFMEPRPKCHIGMVWFEDQCYPTAWWRKIGGTNKTDPAILTLDRLHEVESRLTDEQWRHYCSLMFQHTKRPDANPIQDLLTGARKTLLHASAAQKIAALATVLNTPEATR